MTLSDFFQKYPFHFDTAQDDRFGTIAIIPYHNISVFVDPFTKSERAYLKKVGAIDIFHTLYIPRLRAEDLFTLNATGTAHPLCNWAEPFIRTQAQAALLRADRWGIVNYLYDLKGNHAFRNARLEIIAYVFGGIAFTETVKWLI